MKRVIYMLAIGMMLLSCNRNKISILNNGYIGMTTDEFKKTLNDDCMLNTSSSKISGKLKPAFVKGRLASLSIYINDISDFDTAYNVYELGNDLNEKYGPPFENKETIWAGGASKYFKWRKGQLEVEYSYKYDQVPGTNGLLYTGEAKVVYNDAVNLNLN